MRRLALWIALLLPSAIPAQTLEQALEHAPALAAQPDGTLCLPAESAVLTRWFGNQVSPVAATAAVLRVQADCFVRWCGDGQQPAWRCTVPAAGRYRVVLTRAASAGETGTAELRFSRARPLRFAWEATPDNALQPFIAGEVDLAAGVEIVSFRPETWLAESRFGRLRDIRLVPLDAVRRTEPAALALIARAGFDRHPDVAALAARGAELKAITGPLASEVRRRDFSSFTNLQQFLDFDLLRPRYEAADAEGKRLGPERNAALRRLAAAEPGRFKPEDWNVVAAHLAAVASAEAAATNAYPSPGPSPEPPPRTTLFPIGNRDTLPAQPIDATARIVELQLGPPPDAAERSARFARRNDPAGLAALCDELRRALIAGTPGLEDFERLAAAGQAGAALEAFRTYFFAKLADPERFGAATENLLFDLTRQRGRGELLLRPSPLALEKNLAGAAVSQVRDEVVIGAVGPPGAVSWVPFGLDVPVEAAADGRNKQHAFWNTPAGREAGRTLDFFLALHALPSDNGLYYAGGLFPALLWSYAIGGDRAHLARWCAYADDWALHARRDRDEFPFGLRNATELETQPVRCTLNLFRLILDERPDFARDFDAATLARLLLVLAEDYAPYVIRARRAEMANWGIMGICHQLHFGRFLHEFRAWDSFNREAWRLWLANMIQHRTPDGENMEAWDDGHNWIDIDYAEQSVPFARRPAAVTPEHVALFWDRVRNDQRRKLVHLSPLGNYWPGLEASPEAGRNTLREKARPDGDGTGWLSAIVDEPGARRRLEAVRAGGPGPARRSDFAPYAAMAYLREGWGPDDDYLILQNFRERSQNQVECPRSGWSLSRRDRILVEAPGLAVDRKPDNRYFGLPRAGGKTGFCAQAGRAGRAERFHTSDRFDFAEAVQDSPYALHRESSRFDLYGLYRTGVPADDPAAITNVSVVRQVFGVRGQDLWIICDRIRHRGTEAREFTQFFTLPIRVAQNGFADRVRLLAAAATPAVSVDETQAVIRTASPGFENVSVYCFAPAPLRFDHILNAKREHARLPRSPLESILLALKNGKPVGNYDRAPILQPVSVRWTGAGDQVFITVLASRGPLADLANPYAGELRWARARSNGCELVTADGTRIEFTAGSASEARLTVHGADDVVYGIELGDEEPGFEFEGRERCRVAALHRAIELVRFSPPVSAFTDQVDVRCELPGAASDSFDLRYTLDGSEPTVDSARCEKPVRLTETTLLKVRPFRRGLIETPWTYDGIESGPTVGAVFRKEPLRPAAARGGAQPGLAFLYFEDRWPRLFTYAGEPGVLEAKARGTTTRLLDADELARVRQTDGAYAVRYEGFLNVPADGVYSFHAPEHLFAPTRDAGYDLRVWVDGEEWFPHPDYHAEHQWDVPLAKGAHRFAVAFVDYRARVFRNDYWMVWQPEQMGTDAPKLELSGPGLSRRAIPSDWLTR